MDQSQASQTVLEHAKIMTDIYDRMAAVHDIKLHEGQIKVARLFFNENKRIIQCQWGRNGGKTTVVIFIAVVYALLNPNSEVYIICPEKLQGKKIYFNSGRLPNFAPPEYVKSVMTTDLRVLFNNGSSITVDGCENYNGLRGIKPHLVIYDEFQDHNREFDIEVMRPNLLAKRSCLLVMGTPPKRDCYYVEFRKRLLEEIASGDNTRDYIELPCWYNPIMDMEELEKVKKQLIKSGDEKVWLREYEAKLVFGGEGAVFPHFNENIHVRPHSLLTKIVEAERDRLQWFCISDPGTSSVFATLFGAYNPARSQLFLFDEIYEKDRLKTATTIIWPRIRKMQQELYPNVGRSKWRNYYDEAEAWFANEIQVNYGVSVTPTSKQTQDIEQDISRLKTLMLSENSLLISDRCRWLIWEILNYVTDEHDCLPKDHDHLIDCLRYMLHACSYKLIHTEPLKETVVIRSDNSTFTDEKKRVYTLDQKYQDWADQVIAESLGFYDRNYH